MRRRQQNRALSFDRPTQQSSVVSGVPLPSRKKSRQLYGRQTRQKKVPNPLRSRRRASCKTRSTISATYWNEASCSGTRSGSALLLASDYTTAVTGEVLYVDGGFHIEGMVFH